MEKFAQKAPSKELLKKSAQKKREDMADMSKSSDTLKSFQVGQRVRLQGMSSSELNGAEGIVVESESGGCVTVKLRIAPSAVLQQHPNRMRVEWENIEWLSQRLWSSMTVHFTMYADDDTGRTLTLSESREKMQLVQETILRAHEERGKVHNPIRLYNTDMRTNTDHMNQSDAREFLQQHIGKLRNAHQLFMGYGAPVNMIDSECLALYETLFVDMLQHKSIWHLFFESIKNTVWCERSVGIMNTYATVLRQRVESFREAKDDRAFASLTHCERVLNLGGKLIKRYKISLVHPTFLEVAHFNNVEALFLDQKCAEGLTYRYLLIKHNVLLQTGRGHNINPSEIRFLCELELDPTSGAVDKFGQIGNRLAVLMDILERPCTRRALSMTTNAEIAAAYKLLSKKVAKDSDYGSDITVPNRMCGSCGFFEEEGVKMKRCARCMIEFYCSAECQRDAWPDHQLVCNPPETQVEATP